MPSVIERASTGRAKCRVCGQAIARGDERFGEALPNAYGEGESLFWFHLPCAACARPEALLPVLGQSSLSRTQRDELAELASEGIAESKLCRLVRAERASSGRARCRQCRELIDNGAWRLALHAFEEGRFTPIGTIHARCAFAYFGREPSSKRLTLPGRELTRDELAEVSQLLREGRALEPKGLAKTSPDERPAEPARKSSSGSG